MFEPHTAQATAGFGMLSSSLLTFCSLALIASVHAVPLHLRASGISQDVFSNLDFFMKYASSAYADSCATPNGNTLVKQFSIASTDTQGFVARDDTRQQIVVALRGTSDAQDFTTDEEIAQVPLVSQGVNAPSGTLVHQGFLNAWNSAASTVIDAVGGELKANPNFAIVTSGHSLGGALSSLAAVSMAQNFPGANVTMFTYGQPRTGNAAYVKLVDSTFPAGQVLRSVHTFDGVPTIIPQGAYQHHGTEFFNFVDPASATTVKQCQGDEDKTCSDSIPSSGINAAHLEYFNRAFDTSFCN